MQYRRHLPHLQTPHATLFVTTGLAGTRPSQMAVRRNEAEASEGADQATGSRAGRAFVNWDDQLAQETSGPQWFKEPAVASALCETIRALDGDLYKLLAYCVMPNHLHLLIEPLSGADGCAVPLSEIMRRLKGRSALACNRLLARQGAFWQQESYDHIVRDGGELERIVRYIRHNPVRAGLVTDWSEWPWTYVLGG